MNTQIEIYEPWGVTKYLKTDFYQLLVGVAKRITNERYFSYLALLDKCLFVVFRYISLRFP